MSKTEYKEIRIHVFREGQAGSQYVIVAEGISPQGPRRKVRTEHGDHLGGINMKSASRAESVRVAEAQARDFLQGKDPDVSTNRVVILVDRAHERILENKIVVKKR